MNLSCKIGTRTHQFRSLTELMAKATPVRSGDALAGISAATMEERLAAQTLLADQPLVSFLEHPLIPYEQDEVTRLIIDSHDAKAFAPLRHFSVGDLRDWLLSDLATESAIKSVVAGLIPEMVAAVSKLMRNQDLILIASKCNVVTRFRNTLGLPGSLAVRLQPNHPVDDPRGVLASTLDGLMYGTGDACIGVNPVSDTPAVLNRIWRMLDEFIAHYEIPTQSCVLTHITRQIDAIEQGLPVDLVFQSIAGTEAANKGFGINLAMLRQAQQAALELGRGTVGNNVMYFETGQGSALSSNSHHGVDQQTCEARAYAVAREFNPLLVNTVVGFIGPEYLYDGKQIMRAGLEDHFCGKLLGLPMGVDVCYTNHTEADQNDMDILLTVLGAAGVNYIMGVPGSDDVMLGYQSTSFHDALYLRKILNKRMAPEFEEWLQKMQIMDRDMNLIASQSAAKALMNFSGAAHDQ